MRTVFLAFVGTVLLCAQISAPFIGKFRDLRGEVRGLYGIAGAFSVQAPADAETEGSDPEAALRIEDDDAVVIATGVRLRLPSRPTAVEPLGRNWYLLRTESALYAVRTEPEREGIYVIPQEPEE